MKIWHLQCVDRHTGKESVEHVTATDERMAFGVAADRGLMVGKVLRVEEPPPPAAAPSPLAPTFAGHPATQAAGGTIFVGVALVIAGIVATIAGLAMDTSVTTTDYTGFGRGASVENIGLLNRQLCTVIVGVGLFVPGAVLLGMVRVCGEVFDSGERILRRLQKDSLEGQLKDE